MKRLQGFTVSPELIASLCDKAPKESTFRYAYFDPERCVFVCVMEHDSFNPVVEGNVIPIDAFDPMLDGPSTTEWRYFDPNGNPCTTEEYIEGIKAAEAK